MEKATELTKLIIVLQPTNVEEFKNRSIADAGVLELAAKVVEAGQEHGFGTASAPTIFKVNGEKVKAYTNKGGDITVALTGIHAEPPKNAPIELARSRAASASDWLLTISICSPQLSRCSRSVTAQ